MLLLRAVVAGVGVARAGVSQDLVPVLRCQLVVVVSFAPSWEQGGGVFVVPHVLGEQTEAVVVVHVLSPESLRRRLSRKEKGFT